jgi:hypothetical protein
VARGAAVVARALTRARAGATVSAMTRSLLPWVLLCLTACAAASRGPGAVELAAPEPVHGDDTAIAWPFVVTHEGEREIVADFHLRIEEGGTLVGVRPDAQNPDGQAILRWRGEVRAGEGYWTGDVLPRGAQVRLWALVRPTPGRDPRLRVVHWPTDGRDNAVGDRACEIWSYDTSSRRVEREPC